MPANLDPICDAASSSRSSSLNVQAFLEELKQPYKNPAPRGRKIISAEHARFLHLNESQLTQRDYDSTLSSEADASIANVSKPITPSRNVAKLTNSQRRANARKLLAERQNQYHQQEMALGGYHDVFNDPCPVFKPRDFRREDSIASTDDEEAELPDPISSDSQMSVNENSHDENAPRSSQGRFGQGCSTPRCMANNTLAPLRAIDVSAVTPCESVEDCNAFRSPSCVRGPATRPKTRLAPPPVLSTIAEPATAARDDSMEDVLSRMRKNPNKAKTTASVMVSSKLLDTAHNKLESVAVPGEAQISAVNNGTYTIEKEGTFTVVNAEDSKRDGTYVVVNDETYTVTPTQNATLTLDAGENEPGRVAHVADSSEEHPQQVQPEPAFAVPVIPARKGKNFSKITVDEREQRLNISQKKNKSLLEAMNVDMPSPGRALFASRPTKKPRTLPKTPVRSKPTDNDDAMEVSIAMSDISEQPSNASNDSSMVDPVSDPGPPQSTPTRAPGFIRRSGITPTGVLRTPPTPSNRDSQKSAAAFVKMSAEKKREIIKKSVERLSQPKLTNTICHRAEANPPHSPYVRTRSADVTMVEPVTPFEPIDPSRMIVANADRSGTAQRIPKPRFARKQAGLSVSLFAGKDESTPRPLRSSLLKRMGDYKPIKIVEEAAVPGDDAEPVRIVPAEPVASTSAANTADETMVVHPAPPPTAADTSDASFRATAGKNAVQTTSVISASPNDDMLANAARSLSLEDLSPGETVPDASDGMDDLPVVYPQPLAQKLLAESLCTVNTPQRAASTESSKRRISTDNEAMEEDTVLANDSVSSESDIIHYDTIEVQPQSRCSSRGSEKGDEVMILKPRVVVHPKPPSTPNVRRSTRNRMKPVRQWLGEKPIYTRSPGGSKILVGVNEVEVRDKRWLKVRTADYKLAQERERQLAERQRRLRELRKEEARKRKEYKIRELKKRHRRGEHLEITVDSIVTSSDEDEEEDIEAIIHVH